jgi:hypothetical protein
MEFHLLYQGLLKGTGGKNSNSEHKHDVRRYFHKQLVNLWNSKEPLKSRAAHLAGTGPDELANTYHYGSQRFVPIVCDALSLCCELEILLLRRDLGTILASGDLDNRIKTLIDALRIPVSNEYHEGPENPLYCLMQDDKLIYELKVVGDHLLANPEQVIEHPRVTPSGEYTINTNHVCAVIKVHIKPLNPGIGNLDFA